MYFIPLSWPYNIFYKDALNSLWRNESSQGTHLLKYESVSVRRGLVMSRDRNFMLLHKTIYAAVLHTFCFFMLKNFFFQILQFQIKVQYNCY